MRILSTAALLLMLVPAAHAQDDACSEAEPCVWVVEVEESGLDAPAGDLEGTVGDWHYFEFNDVSTEQEHTITYSLSGESWAVGPAPDTVESEPFQLDEEGTFQLTDDVTGDTLPVEVVFDDVAGGDDDAGQKRETEEDEGAPFAPIAWVLLGLALVALIVRRR